MLELIKPPTVTLPMSPCDWMVALFTKPATVILDSLADVNVSRLASKSPRTPPFLSPVIFSDDKAGAVIESSEPVVSRQSIAWSDLIRWDAHIERCATGPSLI